MTEMLEETPTAGLSIQLNKSYRSENRMYLIPPVVGSSTIYASLANRVADTFHCTGLQYPGFDSGNGFAASIEEMAQSFFEEIMRNEHNKVYLLGYSFGALAAFETAKLLEGVGIEVELVLIDRGVVKKGRKKPTGKQAADWSEIIEAELGNWYSNKMVADDENIRNLIRQNLHNLSAYEQTGSIAGNILVIESAQGSCEMKEWKKYTSGRFQSHTSNEGHYTLLSDPLLPVYIRNFAGSIVAPLVSS
jgi:thioesterase domain-containing protein